MESLTNEKQKKDEISDKVTGSIMFVKKSHKKTYDGLVKKINN